ncbi:MAG: hypothetical protein FJ290_09215 [Planctomycetes bacterium]|nr:hypothetical protein [Planctomycetota bacterium]
MVLRDAKGLVERSAAKRRFRADADRDEPGLPWAIGCYVFGTRAGRGIKPWYVGLASSQPFQTECFALHKITIYDRAVAGRKGNPILFLLARRTPTGRFAKPSDNKLEDLTFLETFLKGIAFRKNKGLMNVAGTKRLRMMEVPGLLNSPRGANARAVIELRKALNV